MTKSTANAAIAAAIEPLRASAMQAAEETARRATERAYTALSAKDWDLNAAFPYPYGGASKMPRQEYEMAKGRRQLAEMIVTRDESKPTHYRIDEPYYVIRDDVRQDDYIHFNVREASIQFDAYVIKLSGKVEAVGPVAKAEISEQDGVWGYSTLTCTHESGEVSVWRTKQIVNVSKLGKLFNQWPTHRIK